ncbi:DUF2480 family protein [Marinilongibacter aquaticus]|uniref:DUF2480 family protein n=1 Tax=Marinilongibacter aquaticus TaxID=2975157 RepID=UPI0021BDE1B8|nr:DUF2480 family protein [Marinilongibacter aquaticus]UBM59505.1 DUF2480 family protein [Marinilongibacter aquaticus]
MNKAIASGILPFDLMDLKPTIQIVEFDINTLFYKGLILKEKEFRSSLSSLDFSPYRGKAVAFTCSAETIVPLWAYMALANAFSDNAVCFDLKNTAELEVDLWKENLLDSDLTAFENKKVVIIARPEIPPSLYLAVTALLKPIVQTLMYGEIGLPKVIYKK